MMHFLPTPNTTLYGKNGEGADIAAVRDYNNGGSFNYMGMDVGPYGTANDVNNFTTPWLKGSLDYARNAKYGISRYRRQWCVRQCHVVRACRSRIKSSCHWQRHGESPARLRANRT
jgi:hypothetical protein